MITIGVDPHKRIHVAAALDDRGSALGQWHGANSPEGWLKVFSWAIGLGEPRRWAIEGAWSYGRGLAQFLVAKGEPVYEINSRWTAAARRGARRLGKSDPKDARAAAAFLCQEVAGLTPISPEDESTVLDLLVKERDSALAEATRLTNQIHALLMQIDPEYKLHLQPRHFKVKVAALEAYRTTSSNPVQQQRTAAVRRLAQRLRLVMEQAKELAKEIRARAKVHFSPLTRMCGIDYLRAGAIAAALGPGLRFRNDAQLAAYAGAAPLEASSAGLVRHRLNRGGNRRLNAILYGIVLTQCRSSEQAKAYLDRRQREGKTRREAVRALKRFLIRAIWRLWLECMSLLPGGGQTLAPSLATRNAA